MDNRILQDGVRIINRYNSFTNKVRKYGTEEDLYPAEIHLIDAIGLDGNITTTKLAADLGITKGGISQTMSKLVKKGMVIKSEGQGINEIYISLSEQGKKAYWGHKMMHEPLILKINSITEQMDENTKEIFKDIIHAIEDELLRLENMDI